MLERTALMNKCDRGLPKHDVHDNAAAVCVLSPVDNAVQIFLCVRSVPAADDMLARSI